MKEIIEMIEITEAEIIDNEKHIKIISDKMIGLILYDREMQKKKEKKIRWRNRETK